MLNNMNEFSNAVGTVVNDAVRRAMRKNSGQFEGTWEYHVITPNVAYTMPNEFVWVSTVKYTSQASVAFARRIDCNFDITIDSTHATHSSNGLPLNELDCEIFPDAQHPLYWPTPRYVQGGQRGYTSLVALPLPVHTLSFMVSGQSESVPLRQIAFRLFTQWVGTISHRAPTISIRSR